MWLAEMPQRGLTCHDLLVSEMRLRQNVDCVLEQISPGGIIRASMLLGRQMVLLVSLNAEVRGHRHAPQQALDGRLRRRPRLGDGLEQVRLCTVDRGASAF